jgi:hypothetical protein
MQAATVAILVEKAEFKHETAVAIAEAIDVAIAGAGLVTVAILDARLSELRAEIQTQIQELRAQIQEVKAELVRWVFVVMLGNVALSAGATALLNALQHGH